MGIRGLRVILPHEVPRQTSDKEVRHVACKFVRNPRFR